VLVYFAKDIVRIVSAWVAGLHRPEVRGSFDYRFACSSSGAACRSV
jgi:hypothetical protein